MANPTPIVITDSNGKTLTITGSTSGSQVAAPTPVILTDVNGNALVLGSASSSGTVNSGTIHQLGIYAATGTAVSGDSLLTDSGTILAYTGTGGISLVTGSVLSWNSDTGLSRDSGGAVDIGNGTAGDKSGAINAQTANFTGIATVGALTVGAGTLANPGILFNEAGTNGIWSPGNSDMAFEVAGVDAFGIISTQIRVKAGLPFGWASGNPSGTALDTGLSRDSAGVVDFGNGTQGDKSGSINLTGLTATGAIAQSSGQVHSWNADTAISRDAAGVIDIGTGAQGSKAGSINLTNLTATGTVALSSGQVLSWNADTAISRDAAGVFDFGTGAAASKAGTINATTANITGTSTLGTLAVTGKISTYNGVATVSNGHASEIATVDSTGLVASTGTLTLYAVPSNAAGQYRISGSAKLTHTGTAPVIGPLTITYTDPDGTVCAMVIPWINSAGAVAITGNATNSTTATGVLLFSDIVVNAALSTNIQYSFPESGTVGAATWNLHLKCEALG